MAGWPKTSLDHRLNSRTVYMNPVFRFIYWNMNYHVEHHMFPMVPYHALPKLHELIKHDLPAPTPSILAGLSRDDPGVPAPAAQRGLFPQARAAADGASRIATEFHDRASPPRRPQSARGATDASSEERA